MMLSDDDARSVGSATSNKPSEITVLMAEDDEGHALLVQRNLRRAGITNPIVHATDGQHAIDFFEGRGKFQRRDSHADLVLVLLDINMPRIDGLGVLKYLRSHKNTATTPVIMLTTTESPHEINHCYELGCSLYVRKPVDYNVFVEAVKRLGHFLSIVQVPHGSLSRS